MTLNHVLDCLNHSLDLARLHGFSGHFVSITSTKSCGFSSYKTCNVKIYFNSKVEKESKLICSIDNTSKINNIISNSNLDNRKVYTSIIVLEPRVFILD